MRSGDASARGTAGIQRTLEVLHEPGEVFEARIPKTKERTVSGYFNDAARAASAIATLDGRTDVHGIYGTLNPIQASLTSALITASNRTPRVRPATRTLCVGAGCSSISTLFAQLAFPAATRNTRPHSVAGVMFLHFCASAVGLSRSSAIAATAEQLLYAIDLPNDDPARKTGRTRVNRA